MNEFNKILDKGEKVLWEGKPQFLPFVIGSGGMILFLFMLIIFTLPTFLFALSIGLLYIFLPYIAAITLVFSLFPLYQVLLYKCTHYSITNKRVLLQKGIIGRDFNIVDFDQITNAEVNVGLIDKIFGKNSGTILVSTAGSFSYTKKGAVKRPYTLHNIEDPYNVFKFFKKVSYDVKTDINYPNKYRPKLNPGYNTDYKDRKPKKK